MIEKNKSILIKLLLIAIIYSGCSHFNHNTDSDYIELYSHEYNGRTRCIWPSDLITTNREISDYSISTDALLLRRIDVIMNELSRDAIKNVCINARIVCIVHRSNRVDTISFGWDATELNSIGYRTLDTGLIRFIGHYLSKTHRESIDDYLRGYANRIKKFEQ